MAQTLQCTYQTLIMLHNINISFQMYLDIILFTAVVNFLQRQLLQTSKVHEDIPINALQNLVVSLLRGVEAVIAEQTLSG